MRFSLAYNEDGSILTAPFDEEAQRLPRSGDTSDLLDTTFQVPDAEPSEAMEDRPDEMAARQFIQGNTRQEARDGPL